MNIREISDVFKDTAAEITQLKSYNFGWASDRVRQGNAEDFQELNLFPRLFFSVPTITATNQTRKQDTYQVTLFFDDLLGYDNEGDEDPTMQIDKWAMLQQYATAFIQRLNLIKQSILPNYLFIPDSPQMTFDSFTGMQRLITVQVDFTLIVPTNCEVTVQRIITLIGNVIAQGSTESNIFLSNRISAYVESSATSTGAIVSGQQQIIEVDSSVTAFALSSGDIVRVKSIAANTVANATVQAEVQRAVNVIGELNATGQVSGNINLTLFINASSEASANVTANLEVTTQGLTECEANVVAIANTTSSVFITRILEAESLASASTQSQIILSKLLSGAAIGSGVSESSLQLSIPVSSTVNASANTTSSLEVTTQNVTTVESIVTANGITDANIQLTIPVTSSSSTEAITNVTATLTKVIEASVTATANTESSAQLTIAVNAETNATATTSAEANLSYTVNAETTATAQTTVDAQITRTIEASATATATTTVEAGIGVTFVVSTVASGSVTNAELFRSATLESSLTANGTTTSAITTAKNVAASVSGAATVTNSNLQLFDPNFANVSLLLHGNGSNGSTTFTDNSPNNFTVTANGNAQVDTTVYKFGSGSIELDGNGDYLSIPDNVDFQFGTGDFTIETWVRFNSVSGFIPIVSNGLGAAGGNPLYDTNWSIYLTNNNLYITKFVSNNQTDFNFSWTPSIDTWYHVAIARNGTSLKAYVDGSQIGSTQTSSTNYSGATNNTGFSIGRLLIGNGGAVASYLNGYLDDIRIIKGVARYTGSTFTVPTREFLDQ